MISDDAKVLTGIGLVTLLVFGGIMFAVSKETSPSKPVADEILVREDSWRQGTPEAPVTLVEFLDFECEACRAAHPQIKKIIAEYEGKLTYIIRYFPLHTNSVLAAKAAEAAGEQGKYWEMVDLLFERQTEWGEKKVPQSDFFRSYAVKLELDMEKFNSSLDSSAYEDKVERDRRDGVDAGVKGTPTVFLDGGIVTEFPTYDTLKRLIEKQLSR